MSQTAFLALRDSVICWSSSHPPRCDFFFFFFDLFSHLPSCVGVGVGVCGVRAAYILLMSTVLEELSKKEICPG